MDEELYPGFYRWSVEDDMVFYAPNFVSSPTFELTKELKDTYTYPIGGWYWFDTRSEAIDFWNLPEDVIIA